MAMKKYILTIQFDDNGDNCEYVKEEFVDDTPENLRVIYEAEAEGYFSKSTLAMLVGDEIAEA